MLLSLTITCHWRWHIQVIPHHMTVRSHDPKAYSTELQTITHSNLMAWVRALWVNAVYVFWQTSMKIPVIYWSAYLMANEKVLIDSGATANFLNWRVAKQLGFRPKRLEHPVPVKNVNETPNKDEQLTHCVHLWVQLGEKKELMLFYLTNLKEDHTLLGFPWLTAFNPKVNWTEGTMEDLLLCITSKAAASQKPKPTTKREGKGQQPAANHEEREQIFMIPLKCKAINKTTISTDLAAKQAEEKKEKSWFKLVPPSYHQHAKVFSKEEAKQLPPHCKWDHAIALTADAPKTLKCKTYPLTLKEQDAIDEIIKEQLEKEYIRPVDSPYVLQIFFVSKKDGSFHLVQDYRVLNKYTILNHYPLPNLEDLTCRLANAQLFTALTCKQATIIFKLRKKTNRKLHSRLWLPKCVPLNTGSQMWCPLG